MTAPAEPFGAARIIGEPTRYSQLREFSCDGGAPGSAHVDRVIARLAGGAAIPQTLMALEDGDGALLAVCSYWLDQLILPLHRAPLGGVPYINVIGVDRRYQGHRRADGSSVGDAMMAAFLAHIRELHGQTHVFALVSPLNTRGEALFTRHLFGEILPANGGRFAMRVRPPLPG